MSSYLSLPSRSFVPCRAALIGLLAAVLATATPTFAGPCGAPGTSRLLATMPVTQAFPPPTGPTYPEGVALLGDRVVTSGPATFGTAGNGSPSQLTIFDRETGVLRAQVPLVGEDLAQEHALSELAAWKNYLYAPSTQLGVVRWRFDGKSDSPAQESWSTPFCSVSIPFPCHIVTNKCPANINPGFPPLPNGLVVDSDGDTYITDSLQGIVWFVPRSPKAAKGVSSRGAIAPEVLFCARELQGSGTSGFTLFGANGIAAVGDWLYVAVSFGPVDGSGAPTSVIYRIPKQSPTLADLEVVYTYAPVPVPPFGPVPPIADGLRYDEKHRLLYVVLGGQNQVSVLDLGVEPVLELTRYSRTGPDHPFLNPATVALDGKGRAYVANHAITCCLPGDPRPECASCSDAQNYFGVIELCVQ